LYQPFGLVVEERLLVLVPHLSSAVEQQHYFAFKPLASIFDLA
tara:strand:- start:548 stop:676 length:129 start_codon:yes stop_codon:yes gene_type:complete